MVSDFTLYRAQAETLLESKNFWIEEGDPWKGLSQFEVEVDLHIRSGHRGGPLREEV